MFAIFLNKEVTGVYATRQAVADVLVRDDEAVVEINEDLSERTMTAISNFCTGQSLTRMRDMDKAVANIKAYLKAQKKSEQVPAPAKRPRGVKSQLRTILVHEKQSATSDVREIIAYTLGELMQMTGGEQSTVQTALSDLRSEKYAGKEGPLNIKKTEAKGFYIAHD